MKISVLKSIVFTLLLFVSINSICQVPTHIDSNTVSIQKEHKSAIKLGLLSPFIGGVNFGFETKTGNRSSVEATVGIIGLGCNINHRADDGIYVSGAYKYFISKEKQAKSTSHVLGGVYIKPIISYSSYNSTYRVLKSSTPGWMFYRGTKQYGYLHEKVNSASITLNTGLQLVLNNSVLFDFYLGAGYGIVERSGSETPSNHTNHYSHVLLNNVAITGGIKFGLLL